MKFTFRSKAEGEIYHSGSKRLLDLSHVPSTRWTRSRTHGDILAEERGAAEEQRWRGIVEEGQELEAGGEDVLGQEEDDRPHGAHEQVHLDHGEGGGGGRRGLLLPRHQPKWNS